MKVVLENQELIEAIERARQEEGYDLPFFIKILLCRGLGINTKIICKSLKEQKSETPKRKYTLSGYERKKEAGRRNIIDYNKTKRWKK